jgi:glycerophosphoryl diester phosphodiesterase
MTPPALALECNAVMGQIAVCAHRGASTGNRPGTLESFRRAAESRFDHVEFDVRRLGSPGSR